jgi:hypothetical protein
MNGNPEPFTAKAGPSQVPPHLTADLRCPAE